MPHTKQSTLPWTITDGRAGNLRQAVALASALRLGGQQRLQLEPHAPWRWLAPRCLPGMAHGLGEGFAETGMAQDRGGQLMGLGEGQSGHNGLLAVCPLQWPVTAAAA